MEMQQVRYFCALAQTLNFTHAAAECNVTQPTLTRAIQSLEAELGGALIRRERHQTHLTELGRQMLPLLRQCYEAAMSAHSLARAMAKSDLVPLVIVVSRSVNIALIADQLSELARAYPGLQLKIRREAGAKIVDMLKLGEADLALAGPLKDDWDRIDSWPLFVEPFEFAVNCGHVLATQDPDEIECLATDGVMISAECDIAEEITDYLVRNGLVRLVTFEAETDQDLMALLESHVGVGLVPVSAPGSHRVRRITRKNIGLRRSIALYGVAGRRRSAVATTLLNLLRAADWSACERVQCTDVI